MCRVELPDIALQGVFEQKQIMGLDYREAAADGQRVNAERFFLWGGTNGLEEGERGCEVLSWSCVGV